MKVRESTFWRRIKVEGVQARREMVRDGLLLPTNEFCLRIGVSETKLARLQDAGSVFSIAVDGTQYFPSLLAEPGLDRSRLQSICRILVPAPPACRLDYLSSKHGNLGDLSPIEMLRDDKDYKWLREMARAWAAEWSRTAVKVYEGKHETEPSDIEPLYTAIAEIDPRRPLWTRASEALHAFGYQWPLGPYPATRTFTIFVERQTAGYSAPISEACIQVSAKDNFFHVRIRHCVEAVGESQATFAAKSKTVVDAAKKIIVHFRKR